LLQTLVAQVLNASTSEEPADGLWSIPL
jgi:hypothetical protein